MHLVTLLILFCLACAGPVLNIVVDGPAFFVNRRATPSEIVVFVGLVVVAVPALLWGLAAVCSQVSRRLGSALRGFNIFILSSLALLPAVSALATEQGVLAIVLAVLGGLLCAALYLRVARVRKLVLLFFPLAIIVPAQLLTSSELRSLLWPSSHQIESSAEVTTTTRDVVVVIFDEFSLNVLMTESGEIDALRFPHFARLASQSIWFRNATSVNQFTPLALPAILSGLIPKNQNQLPTTQQYPTNLFTLLSSTHDIRALEPFTKLCPERVCPSAAATTPFWKQIVSMLSDASAVYLAYAIPPALDLGIPEIDGKWGDFWNEEAADWDAPEFDRGMRFFQYRDFIGRIRKGSRPTLYFMHMILPHMPFQFTPGGFSYRPGAIRTYALDHWVENPALQQVAYSQYLAQVGTSDGLLGRLMAKLKAEGIWDDAVVVVTADHGISFEPNTYRRGHPGHASFYQDIMSVPFFLKLPGQIAGQVRDRNVEAVDVLPTIIESLGGKVNAPFDGRSALSAPEPLEKRFFVGRIPGRVGAPGKRARWGDDLAGQLMTFPMPKSYPLDTIRWKYSLPGYRTATSTNPFFIGPFPELLQREVGSLTLGEVSNQRYQIRTPGLKDGALMHASDAGVCPCLVQGVLHGQARSGRVVAMSINGRIEALSHTFMLSGDSTEYFSFLMREQSFKLGANAHDLYEVRGDDPSTFRFFKIPQQ